MSVVKIFCIYCVKPNVLFKNMLFLFYLSYVDTNNLKLCMWLLLFFFYTALNRVTDP